MAGLSWLAGLDLMPSSLTLLPEGGGVVVGSVAQATSGVSAAEGAAIGLIGALNLFAQQPNPPNNQGPGRWVNVNRHMSERAAQYQMQVTGQSWVHFGNSAKGVE